MTGGEQEARGAALGQTEEGAPLDARRVHHRLELRGALLERGDPRDGIGETGPRLVEHDEPGEGRQSLEPRLKGRVRPGELDVGDERGRYDNVDRTLANYLISEVELTAAR